jgi:hypothetical protein
MPAGRPTGTGGTKLTEAHRDKIKNSNILTALIEHVEGKREMSGSQVTAGLGLLKKCLPDLSTVEHTGEDGGPLQVIVKRYAGD